MVVTTTVNKPAKVLLMYGIVGCPLKMLLLCAMSGAESNYMEHTGGNSMRFLTLMVTLATAVISAASQTPAQKPAFAVASIKPDVTSNIPPSYEAQPGGRFVIGNAPFKLIVALAYTLRDYQVLGGPGWITIDRWDVQATAPEGSISAGLEYPSPATPNTPAFSDAAVTSRGSLPI